MRRATHVFPTLPLACQGPCDLEPPRCLSSPLCEARILTLALAREIPQNREHARGADIPSLAGSFAHRLPVPTSTPPHHAAALEFRAATHCSCTRGTHGISRSSTSCAPYSRAPAANLT
ncbi:uncharacterized protein TRAVEDRAFT_30171, partial [Trametes versicolor FP-101664 SS1]|uniref:uncharacterized protein n=1 Tax=Trametes versicolor (strain FP-101664) TaxID=717944 RepID=UPI0004621402